MFKARNIGNKLLSCYKRYTIMKNYSSLSSIIDIHPEVKEQLMLKKSIVALESTIITHGMPYPHNLETALEVENIVRKEGSTPATIAIIDGRIKIGLTEDQLKRLASSCDSENIIKCSRRDIGYVLSKKLSGGTTVAGTLIIANMVGIKIFATGGIGGVHRDGHNTLDISADLIELGKTPIAVISSGIKSILDIPRTLEYLETQGVCVATYKCSSLDFPAFYTRSSGSTVSYNLNNSTEAAELIKSYIDINLMSGILIGVPVPKENAISDKLINDAIESALDKAKIKNIFGKQVTPFILEAVSQITKGKSLDTNKALIKNNARVASEIAVKLYNMMENDNKNNNNDNHKIVHEISNINGDQLENIKLNDQYNNNNNVPVVIGASILDLCMTVKDDFKLDGATYRAEAKISGGGVGRNIAECIWKIYGDVRLISAIGNDEIGKNLKQLLPNHCNEYVTINSNYSTSMCNVVFDQNGDCKLVLGDMKIHESITSELILKNVNLLSKSPLIIIDSNITVDTMGTILEVAKKFNKPVFFEPTDMRIAAKPFQLPRNLTKQIKIISPNIYELQEITNCFNSDIVGIDLHSISNNQERILKIAKKFLETIDGEFDCVLVTLGAFGVIVNGPNNISQQFFDNNLNYIYKSNQNNNLKSFHFMAPKIKNLINVSGAGDSFTGGFISSALQQKSIKNCISTGFYAAGKALQSESAVPKEY